jgi:AraC-like DNA-binding protein
MTYGVPRPFGPITDDAKKRRSDMALTRDFKETIQDRARRDAAFREALLKEAVDALLSGDVETGKTVLRDYINATVGFDKLASVTKKSTKSLMRMLGPERQSSSSQFLRDRRLFTEKRRSALESARNVGLAARTISIGE